MARGRKPRDKKGARKSTSFRLSALDEWHIEALKERYIYGETPTEVVRTALRLLVEKARRDKELRTPPTRSTKGRPEPADDD